MRIKNLLIVLFVCFTGSIYATDYRNITNITNVYNQQAPASLPLAMSAIDFTSNITSTQVGIGGALYKDQYGNEAGSIAFGIGKRFCNTEPECALVKFSGGINEGGGSGVSFGVVWKL